MTRLSVVIFACLALLLFVEQAMAEGRRVALLVGVGAYENVPKLPNAVNDANAMADMFRRANFDVITAKSDLSNIEFKRTIREFEDRVADAEIAVVFYAGHGIEVRDQNYLIPTDAKLVSERDVEDEAIPLERIISALDTAKRLRLIILDACRDNPFASKMKRRVATRGIPQGLAKVEPSQLDTLIAYAAKDKAVANDGDDDHSPYTKALLEHLTEPGLDIRLAFGRVRDDVLKATKGQQEPYLYGSLGGGTIALVPAMPMANPDAVDDAMKQDYSAVERLGTKEAWQVFLGKYKTGLYADLAKIHLSKLDLGVPVISDAPLTRDPVETVPPAVPGPPKVKLPSVAVEPKPTRAEQEAWDKLEGSTDLKAIRSFVDRFPSSPLADNARRRIDVLERIVREQAEALRAEREAARLRKEDDDRRRKAEAEQRRLEREAALLREREEKARAAELMRQKAEQEAEAKQREAEVRAAAAAAAAERRAEAERVKAAEAAARRKEAEEQAQALLAERKKAAEEALARKRELEEATKAAAAAKAAREAEERERVRQAQEVERQDKAKAAEIAAREKEAAERAKAAELAAQKKQAEERAQALRAEQKKAAEEAAAHKRELEEVAKAAAAAKAAREAEERERVRQAQEVERQDKAKAAEIAAREKEAAERAKAAELAAQKEQAQEAVQRRKEEESLKAAGSDQDRARVVAETERKKAAEAARAANAERARRAAAAQQREQAEEARRAANEAIASRKKAAEAARNAARKHAEQAEVAAEKRLRAAVKAKEAAHNRAPIVRAGVHAPARTAYGAQLAPNRAAASTPNSSSYSSTDIGAARMMSRMP